MSLRVSAKVERWPIAGSFVISRGARTEAVVVVAEVSDGAHTGRGECVPYRHYGETEASVVAAIEAAQVEGGREALRKTMPAGAARNALDCALWDLEAKRSDAPAWELAGLPSPRPVATCYTISLGDPETMARAAQKAADRPILKLKLGGQGDPERLRAIRAAVPGMRLVADANEAWTERTFETNMRSCAEAGIELVEQPLPAGGDALLAHAPHPLPICSDECVHVTADLAQLARKYDAVNVKLDKAGGLTEAIDIVREARRRGFKVMLGCMVGTSLAMAPGVLLAQEADWVDLDGPLLLAKDREPGLVYSGGNVAPPVTALWG